MGKIYFLKMFLFSKHLYGAGTIKECKICPMWIGQQYALQGCTAYRHRNPTKSRSWLLTCIKNLQILFSYKPSFSVILVMATGHENRCHDSIKIMGLLKVGILCLILFCILMFLHYNAVILADAGVDGTVLAEDDAEQL